MLNIKIETRKETEEGPCFYPYSALNIEYDEEGLMIRGIIRFLSTLLYADVVRVSVRTGNERLVAEYIGTMCDASVKDLLEQIKRNVTRRDTRR